MNHMLVEQDIFLCKDNKIHCPCCCYVVWPPQIGTKYFHTFFLVVVVVFLKMLESQKNQLGMYIQNVYEISQRDIRASKDLVCPMVCIQSC